jgi:hypothetical protein
VPQLFSLLAQGGIQGRVAMAQHVDGDAAGEVDAFAALLVPQACALAAQREEGGRRVRGDQQLVEIVTGRAGSRHRAHGRHLAQ